MNLIILAAAPVFIIAIFVYVRDKYEREPVGLLLKSILAGGLTTIPVIFLNSWLEGYTDYFSGLQKVGYIAFVVAAFVEELCKFTVLFLLIWWNKDFNEKFDGIVYAVFVSLGFALVENIMYVTSYGEATGYMRALTAVPAHALFGISMGYYLSFARFGSKSTGVNLLKALIWPILLHGVYDFILMSDHPVFLLLFIPFLIYMWRSGFRKMNELSDQSKFKY